MIMPYLKLAAQILRPGDVKNIPNNPVSSGNGGTISKVLQIVFGVAGAVAMLIITIGALQYVISQGNPQSTNKAKDTILYAIVGLVVCLIAFSIVTFVWTNL